MPYIKLDRRAAVDTIIQGLVGRLRSIGAAKGDLNYTVTQVVLGALRPAKGWTYSSLSDAVASLQDAADEIKRRCLGPYEEVVAGINGELTEFAQAEKDMDDKYDELCAKLKADPVTGQPLPPIDVAAAKMYQEVTEAEIKEAFERR